MRSLSSPFRRLRFVALAAAACAPTASTATGDAAVDARAESGGDVGFVSPVETGIDTGIHHDAQKASPVTPVGSALVKVAGAQLAGVTDDGYVAYIDGVGAVWALSLSGGSPTLVVSSTGGLVPTDAQPQQEQFSEVAVSHTFIAAWSSSVSSSAPAPLVVWSAKLGSPKRVAATSIPGVFEAAADGSFLTYADAVGTDGSTATLYGASGDGTNAKSLLTPIVFSNVGENCFPKQLIASPYLVEAYCLAQGFGSAGTPSVVSFDASNGWAEATLVASAIDQIALGADGKNVLAATSTGALEYVPIAGGTPVALDEGNPVSTTATSTNTLFVGGTPARAVYQTASGAIRVAALPSGAASTLATGSVGPIFALSPDGAYVSYASTVSDLVSGYPINFSIVSTVAGGVPLPLDRGNPGTIFSNLYDPDLFDGTEFTIGTPYAFTSDSAYALLSTVPAGTLDDTPPGSLQAASVTGASMGSAVSSNDVFTAVPLTGSRVLWNDGYDATGNANGGPIGDVRVVDFATNDPKLIIAGADADFVVSPEDTTLVYSLNYGTAADGIYAVAIPE